jgi:hypothetical protein
MKPLAFVSTLLCALTETALAQRQVTASDRYRNVMAAHLTADERIAAYEKLLKDSPNEETLVDKILASRHNFPKAAQLARLLTDRNHASIIAIGGGHSDCGKDPLRQALALNPPFSYAAAQDSSHLEDAGNRATNPQIVLH